MNIPPPSDKQARVLWFSLTALAISILLGLISILFWGLGWVIDKLTPVLLPLALAGVIAYLLDPLVDFLERKKIPRTRAIVLVFFAATMLFAGMLATVVPRLIFETGALIERVPAYSQSLHQRFQGSYLGQKLEQAWTANLPVTNVVEFTTTTNGVTGTSNIPDAPGGVVATAKPAFLESPMTAKVLSWTAQILPEVGGWLLTQLKRVGSWLGWLIGLVLVPVYVFYFLKEKSGIQRNWRDYLPVRDSRAKDELIFVLSSINDCLIVFFRGQVLVALCTGTLLTIGFLAMGLNYAVLLGVMAGLLGIIPYLGVMISLLPAVILAAVQFGDWLHPVLVLLIFGLVNLLEGFVISPKIIGDRVGLHPLTIIVSVVVGTTLMGGIIGGVLAIPLTAALRTMMFRYVWKVRPSPGKRR
ncbi:MAG: AI-2E family transporter [Verrucomicrobia bacterium]|nr:AI-2E family transporter [Verrucomicrobiota bacterium]